MHFSKRYLSKRTKYDMLATYRIDLILAHFLKMHIYKNSISKSSLNSEF